VPLTA